MPAVREAPAASSVPPAPRLFLEAPSPLGHSENLKHERDPMLNQRKAWELPSPVLRDALAAPVAETAKGAVRSEHNRAATAEANKGPALQARVDHEPPDGRKRLCVKRRSPAHREGSLFQQRKCPPTKCSYVNMEENLVG